ncbi:MAG: NAD-dependent epimerase/dehydratase family protein, partial [Oscillospiraceae bacterium]|nr:NAD-dependent epimerase/dehydratase family protein [Oscillospiraceae bacterium]
MTDKKKILLLGGTGAIGVYVVPKLIELGYDVYVTTRKERYSGNHSLKYITGNAKDINFLREQLALNYDVIIDFMIYKTEEFRSRIDELLTSCKHYLFLSSYRVYGDNSPIVETSVRLLNSVKDEEYLKTDEYGLTKARQEDILTASKYKNWTILRPSITYSKERFQLGVMEANEFVNRALKHKPIIFPKEMMSKQTTLTWAGDVATLISKLILEEKAMAQSYTLATSEHHTWGEILEYYKDILKVKVKIISLDTFSSIFGRNYQIKYDRMFNRIIDNSKVLADTGVKQSDFMPLYDGLKIELTNFSKNPQYNKIDENLSARIDELTFSPVGELKARLFRLAKTHYGSK